MPTPVLKPDNKGVYYAYWSENRRSRRRSMGATNAAEAETRFARWLLTRNAPTPERATWPANECWAVYFEKHVRPSVVTAPDLEKLWARCLGPHFGALTVPEINQNAVDLYVARRTAGKLGRKAQPHTCRKELAVLVAALRYCAKQRLIAASAIAPIELPPDGAPRDRWLKMDEMQRLLSAAARLRDGSTLSRGERFLWLALETAARQEAILELTWDRVDFETNTIHYDMPGRAKTKKRRAAVSISSSLRPVLERAYRERVNELVLTDRSAIWETIQRIVIEAGLADAPKRGERITATGISDHTLRHTAATWMARRGVPLWKIAKTLGNTTQSVERVYAKWAPEDPAGTVDLISNGALETVE